MHSGDVDIMAIPESTDKQATEMPAKDTASSHALTISLSLLPASALTSHTHAHTSITQAIFPAASHPRTVFTRFNRALHLALVLAGKRRWEGGGGGGGQRLCCIELDVSCLLHTCDVDCFVHIPPLPLPFPLIPGGLFFLWVYPLAEISWGLCVTRYCAGSINLATFITLILINPDAQRLLILHARAEHWLPLDKLKEIHMMLGIMIAAEGFLHSSIHAIYNLPKIVDLATTPAGFERLCELLWRCPFTAPPSYWDIVKSRTGITGVLLLIIMIAITATSMRCARTRNW